MTLIVARQNRLPAASERRLVGMLKRVGLDSAIASSSAPDTVIGCVIEASMQEIRKQCRACSTVDECERWLADKEDGDNSFCPNAKVLKALRVICDDIANNHHIGST